MTSCTRIFRISEAWTNDNKLLLKSTYGKKITDNNYAAAARLSPSASIKLNLNPETWTKGKIKVQKEKNKNKIMRNTIKIIYQIYILKYLYICLSLMMLLLLFFYPNSWHCLLKALRAKTGQVFD